MEVLTTYVRVHAPVTKSEQEKSVSENRRSKPDKPSPVATPVPGPSPDIEAILTVIGRRDPKFERGTFEYLDLTKTDLTSADLTSAHLSRAHLSRAHLSGAD